MAQGTIMPNPKFTGFSNAGAVAVGGKLWTYEAGGVVTPLATYSDVDLTVENDNPVTLDGAGRATVYLSAASYCFVLKDSLGNTLWTQDDIAANAPFSVNLTIPVTAGEDIAAGEGIYLSDGSGSKVAGKWYLWDSDFDYASSLPQIAIASADIDADDVGASIRAPGRASVAGPLTPGTTYYVGSAAGALSASAGTNSRIVGVADTTTSIVLSTSFAPTVYPSFSGRLTLTTNLPVTTADVTAATTVYFTPYRGNKIPLYANSAWKDYTFAQLSIAVPATTNTVYDVFMYSNAGVPTLELSAAWNTATARFAAGAYATLLPTQDGVFVKSTDGAAIDATRLYLGTFRTGAVAGQTEDSAAKRFLWNYYNRVPRLLRVTDATDNWTYNLGTIRQAGANVANQFAFVIGVAEVEVFGVAQSTMRNTTTLSQVFVGVGADSITAAGAGFIGGFNGAPIGAYSSQSCSLRQYPTIGYHYWAWLEAGDASGGNCVFYGDAGSPTLIQTGLSGSFMG